MVIVEENRSESDVIGAPDAPYVNGLAHRYGLAQWVKVYKKEVPRQADLDELVGGHRNNNVPGIKDDQRDPNAVAGPLAPEPRARPMNPAWVIAE